MNCWMQLRPSVDCWMELRLSVNCWSQELMRVESETWSRDCGDVGVVNCGLGLLSLRKLYKRGGGRLY